MQSIETIFTPAEFKALTQQSLKGVSCVVFDILRATTSMVTALGNGAEHILPVATIEEALSKKQSMPGALLAGERDGLRITAKLTGSADFEFGNSPREFTAEKVNGRPIIMTTTNGTRALRACMGADATFAACFLNMEATVVHLLESAPRKLLLVCSGTFEEAAYEDILAAGCMASRMLRHFPNATVCDSTLVARTIFKLNDSRLESALGEGRNGRRLLSRPELAKDVSVCAKMDQVPVVATMSAEGAVAVR